jgi:hypothetical protein
MGEAPRPPWVGFRDSEGGVGCTPPLGRMAGLARRRSVRRLRALRCAGAAVLVGIPGRDWRTPGWRAWNMQSCTCSVLTGQFQRSLSRGRATIGWLGTAVRRRALSGAIVIVRRPSHAVSPCESRAMRQPATHAAAVLDPHRFNCAAVAIHSAHGCPSAAHCRDIGQMPSALEAAGELYGRRASRGGSCRLASADTMPPMTQLSKTPQQPGTWASVC